jgi:type IV pilus assembly protein PilC
VAFKFIAAKPKGRYAIDTAKLRLPIVGILLHKIILSRFCHILGLAIQSGLPVLGAFDIAIESMSNSRLEEATKKARDAINLGEKIAKSLEETKEFPSLVVRMVGVGEESGTLAQSLEKVTSFYDKEIPRALNRLFALFEPMMIMVMGIVVGGIALAIFMPMFKLAQGIGG